MSVPFLKERLVFKGGTALIRPRHLRRVGLKLRLEDNQEYRLLTRAVLLLPATRFKLTIQTLSPIRPICIVVTLPRRSQFRPVCMMK